MIRRQRDERRGERGFTFLEVVVVVALIGLMAAWGYPALQRTMNRIKLTTTAREASMFCQRARMEAVKRGGRAEVNYLTAAQCGGGVPCLLAFADQDLDGAYTAGTDVVVAGPHALPKGIELRGPTDGSLEGANSIAGWDDGGAPNPGPIFNSDGSADAAGAFRFADNSDNFLEVRIEFTGTGKPTIQKWFGGGSADANWYENGELGNSWSW